MRRAVRRIVNTSLLLGGVMLAESARGEGQPSKAAAQVLFDEAFVLLDQGRVPEACDKFAQSMALDPGGGTLLNLALCREREGKLATAWTLFHDAASAAVRDGRSDREATARSHAAALLPRLGRLLVKTGEALSEITIDGQAFPKASWNVSVPIDAGHHTVRAEAEGRKPWSTTVDTSDGALAILVIGPMEKIAAPSVVAPSAPPPVPQWPRTLSWIGVAAGGVTALGGVGFGIDALAQKSIVDSECDGSACSDRGFDAQERGRRSGEVSTGLFIAGGVVLAAGVVGLILTPRAAQPALTGQGLLWTF